MFTIKEEPESELEIITVPPPNEEKLILEFKSEIKPKLEPIDIVSAQPEIILDPDYLKRRYRSKWIEAVQRTFRRPNSKNACQLCIKTEYFVNADHLIEHYKEFHAKESTKYNCTVCDFYASRKDDILIHWNKEHQKHRRQKTHINTGKFMLLTNSADNIWMGDDELVRLMFKSKNKKRTIDIIDNESILGHQKKKRKLQIHKLNYNLKRNIDSNDRMEMHQNPSFDCYICRCSFNHLQILKKHLATKHPIDLQCNVCNKFLGSKHTLSLHMRIHMQNGPKFKCSSCNKQFSCRSSLRRHEHFHQDASYDRNNRACCFCERKVRSDYDLYVHIRRRHFDILRREDMQTGNLNKWFLGLKTFECFKCNFAADKPSTINHIKKCISNGKIYKCPICPVARYSKGKNNLAVHMRKYHTTEEIDKNEDILDKNYECFVCRSSFRKYLTLRRHLKKEHPANTKCDICHRTYGTYGAFKRHKLTHEEKRFKCNVCQRHFSNPYLFKRHESEHLKICKCKICKKVYANRDSLLKHMKIHVQNRPIFKCSFCDKHFLRKDILVNHERIHRDKNYERYKFACTFCERKFLIKYHLYRHIRNDHFDILRKEDKKTGKLNKWFDGIKTFECYKCKHSAEKHVISSHMKKCLSSDRIFKCSFCTSGFYSPQSFGVHKMLQHKAEIEQNGIST